jgi:hypothetical protein
LKLARLVRLRRRVDSGVQLRSGAVIAIEKIVQRANDGFGWIALGKLRGATLRQVCHVVEPIVFLGA